MKKGFRAGVPVLLMIAAASLVPAKAADTYERGPGSFKDEPVALPAIWAGLYLGGHAGYEWGSVDYNVFNLFTSQPARQNSLDANGVIGGGQLGYNFQSGSWVYGAEADLGGLDLSGSKLDVTPPLKNRIFSSSGGFYGDFTGRLGYTAGSYLIYAKGGAAFIDAEFGTFGPQVNGTRSDTLWGWTVGAGLEQRIGAAWSVKLEYQHFDFGSESFDNITSIPQDHRRLTDAPKADAVTMGVNYYVNPGYTPLK